MCVCVCVRAHAWNAFLQTDVQAENHTLNPCLHISNDIILQIIKVLVWLYFMAY